MPRSEPRVTPPDRVDRGIARLPARLRWAAGALRLTLREPADGFDRVWVRARMLARGGTHPGHHYEVSDDWSLLLHARLGIRSPCDCSVQFDRLWAQIIAEMRSAGLALGRRTYGGWDDGDRALAQAVWCLASHLHVSTVVETGVARGVTTRVILEALERGGSGHLWSVDLPALDPNLHGEIGSAVPPRLRARWTYVAGTSRRRLPGLLAEIAPIDLFVHDSSHTGRNVAFELAQAWPAIVRGAVVADDIQQSGAFAGFIEASSADGCYVAAADDAGAMFGIVLKNI